MNHDLCAEDFAPLVGRTFQPAGQPQALTLVSLDTRQRAGWEAAPRQAFSLMLQGPPGNVVPEGLYQFTVDGTQTFELYLVPVQTAARDRQDYQIVFA